MFGEVLEAMAFAGARAGVGVGVMSVSLCCVFSGGLRHIGDELVLYQQRQGVGHIWGLAISTYQGQGLAQGESVLQAAQQRHVGS